MVIVGKNWIASKKFDLSKELGQEAWIIMREPNNHTRAIMYDAQNTDQKTKMAEILDIYQALLPGLVIDHNFYNENQEKLDAKGLIDAIFEKEDPTVALLNQFREWISQPFQRDGQASDSKPM